MKAHLFRKEIIMKFHCTILPRVCIWHSLLVIMGYIGKGSSNINFLN